MVGVPGSGKSTWCKRNLTQANYISRDEIRYNYLIEDIDYFANETTVFQIFISKIVDSINNNYDTIADATHLNKASRAKLLNAIRAETDTLFEIIYVVMDTCLAICLQRNNNRDGRARVPKSTLTKMFNRFQMPILTEDSCIAGIWIIRE